MTALTPALDAALSATQALVFGAVEILLPGYALRLLDGAGSLTFGGNTFVGIDATFGVLSAISDLTDGTGDSVPSLTLTLIPASDAAAATLANAGMQGSQVSIWLGAVDPASGAVIADPYLIFRGQLDVPTLKSSATGRTLDYEVVSFMELLFMNDEGIRLSPAAHQAVWPGETGLNAVTNIDQTIYWGVAPPVDITRAYNKYGVAVPGGGSLVNGQKLSYV